MASRIRSRSKSAARKDAVFKDRLLRALAEKARSLVAREQILPSKTLRDSLYVTKSKTTDTYILGTNYYWAYYYHEGRGPVEPVSKQFLVWFRNPKDDPRLQSGYPKRKSDRKRLTKQQFIEGAARNREMDPSGETMPYMVISKRSKPAIGRPFFDNGLRNYRRAARELIRREFPQFIKERIKLDQVLRSYRSQQFRIRL